MKTFWKVAAFCILSFSLFLKTLPVNAIVIGGDDRKYTEHRDENLAVVKLESDFGTGDDNILIGSGAFISEKVILTSAHNLFDIWTGKRAISVKIKSSFGNYFSHPKIPSDGIMATKYNIYPYFDRDRRPGNDLAVIFLDKKLKGIPTFKVLSEPKAGPFLTLTGYSPYYDSQLTQQDAPWIYDGNVVKGEMQHEFDTEPGQSGAPIYSWPKAGVADILAIHISGNLKMNINYANTLLGEKKKWIESKLR